MGGTSGGNQLPNIPAAASGFQGNPVNMQMPAGMPGQIQSVGNDLNAGFGGDHLSHLQRLYSPTQFKGFQAIPGLQSNAGGAGGAGGAAGAALGGWLAELMKASTPKVGEGSPFEQQSSSLLPPINFQYSGSGSPEGNAAMEAWLAPFAGLAKKNGG